MVIKFISFVLTRFKTIIEFSENTCQKVSFLYVFVIPNLFRIYQEGKARKIINSMKHCLTTVKAF